MREQGADPSGILIIGYGNTLRGDDGLGRYAARALAEGLSRPDVTVLDGHQLTPDLADRISASSLTIFIDAHEGGRPGAIMCEPVLPESADMDTFLHHTSLAGMLVLARELYGACPEAIALSVAGDDFGFREGLSPLVAAALPELVEKCREIMDDFSARNGLAHVFMAADKDGNI